MNNRIIDIILPNYNKVDFIRLCIESLCSQSYNYWRCIIVDGYSDDGSWEVIKRFSKNDSRFELYQLPRTGCLYSAWNYGLSKVNNDFFCILTSDDIWPANWLECSVNSLMENPAAVCAIARTREIDEKGERTRIPINGLIGEKFFKTDLSIAQVREGILDSIAHYFFGNIYTSIHSILMRRKLLENSMRFSEDLGTVADHEWDLQLGLHGSIVYHPNIEVGWRVYENQATDSKRQEETLRYFQKIHLRSKKKIADKIGRAGNDFIKIATSYDDSVLRYHYLRPCIANLRADPIKHIPKLVKVFFQFPQATISDFIMILKGKSFFVEKSFGNARAALSLISENSLG